MATVLWLVISRMSIRSLRQYELWLCVQGCGTLIRRGSDGSVISLVSADIMSLVSVNIMEAEDDGAPDNDDHNIHLSVARIMYLEKWIWLCAILTPLPGFVPSVPPALPSSSVPYSYLLLISL